MRFGCAVAADSIHAEGSVSEGAPVMQLLRTPGHGCGAPQAQSRDELADYTAPEEQHAGDEHRADDDRDPAADDLGEILLQRDDERRAHDRSREGAGAAEEGHEDHLTGSL